MRFCHFYPSVALAGCAVGGPLVETPIVGGTVEERSTVRLELHDFDEFVGRGRVSVARIEFLEIKNGSRGIYSPLFDRIELDARLELSDVRRVLRHELCHALDADEDIVETNTSLFSELADGLFSSDLAPPHVGGPRDEREEAFATYCALGPLAARTLKDSCAGEPAVVARLAQWLSSNVWSQFPDGVERTWYGEPVASSRSTRAPESMTVWATEIPEHGLYLSLGDAMHVDYESGLFDLYSGVSLEIPSEGLLSEPPGGAPPDGLSELEFQWTGAPMGWPDGPAAAWGIFDLNYLGTSAARLFVYDNADAGWQLGLPPCELPSNTSGTAYGLFTADSRVWTSWAYGYEVSWSPVAGP